jgi:phage terminase large subunit GpA-like protein
VSVIPDRIEALNRGLESMKHKFASLDEVVNSARGTWKPPPKLTLSEWADTFFYLSAESSAQVGRWTTIPYQKGIMDAFTDPTVTYVSVMKSARVGWTKIVNALVGFSIHQDPCPMLVVQPTVEDAKGYSTEEIAPMLRDTPVLSAITIEDDEDSGPRASRNTMLHKRFAGGVLSMVGANSGAGFRRISRKRVLFDEVDGYPPSAGSDGDPVALGTKRTEYYWDRKIGHGSTPLLAGVSRIERLFMQGDRRRYYVPCPTCGHMDYLVFTERDSGGHFMVFTPELNGADAHFVCSANGCVIEHKDKRQMVERGEWRANTEFCEPDCPDEKHVHARPFHGHASFHIWAAYSYSPNASWATIAAEFLEAKKDRETLKTFINTALGESFAESGEAPDWEKLYSRRETYRGVPGGVRFLTCGVDVQKDRFIYEVVGWSGFEKESWSIEIGVIPADTSNLTEWSKLDTELLAREFPSPTGTMSIRMLAVDSGYATQNAYNWVRQHERNRVIAVKGVAHQHALISSPTKVDVTHNGKRITRGATLWPVGTSVAKGELYGWLKQPHPVGVALAYPAGWCHFSDLNDHDYFKQLTAEHLVSSTNKKGYAIHEWQKQPGRENHFLDCRVYARAAAQVLGVDRMRSRDAPARPPKIKSKPPDIVVNPPAPKEAGDAKVGHSRPESAKDRFLSSRTRGSWIKRR